MLRTLIVAAVVMGAAGLSAQGRRTAVDRPWNDVGRSVEEWCHAEGRWARNRTACDSRDQSLSGIPELDIDTGGNGSIRVRGTSGSTVRVRFRIVGYAGSERQARELVAAVRIRTDRGQIRATGPLSDDTHWWNVAVDVETPRDMPLTLTTRNGGIGIDGVSGRIRFEATNGSIALAAVAGDVRGRTVNGNVDVELEGRRWDGDGLDVATDNGHLRLRLPPGYSADLHADTDNGGIALDVPVVVRGRLGDLGRHVDATLGCGGAPLRVRTVNGGVSIVRR
jgi:hypothetical protein